VARFPFTRDGWRRTVGGRTRHGGGTKVAAVVGGGFGRLGMNWSVPVGWNGPHGSRNGAGPTGLIRLITAGPGSCSEFKGKRQCLKMERRKLGLHI
jgi:hypothetical protein